MKVAIQSTDLSECYYVRYVSPLRYLAKIMASGLTKGRKCLFLSCRLVSRYFSRVSYDSLCKTLNDLLYQIGYQFRVIPVELGPRRKDLPKVESSDLVFGRHYSFHPRFGRC